MSVGSGLDWVRQAEILPDTEQRRLVALAQKGDRRAADLVVRSIARAVLGEANAYRGSADVEELFAIGINAALEAILKGYDVQRPEAVITYALATARGVMQNEVGKQRKRAARVRPMDDRDNGVHDPKVPAQYAALERAQERFVVGSRSRFTLRRVLDGLPTKQARVARLALLREPAVPISTIAAKEKMSVQHVSNVVRGVVRKVRAEMARQGWTP